MKEGEEMGLIQTNQWLEDSFRHPIKMCEKLVPYFKTQNGKEIYEQLLEFGMYQPSRATLNTVDLLNEGKAWDQIERYFEYYQKKWSGPDIPIFLFPLDQSRGLFIRRESSKSGVSFPDKIFLFLSNLDDPKELEALFVHEYHHVCRLNRLKGNMEDYTLLESLIIEGLAEYAVLKNCGQKYLASWCNMYAEEELEYFWDKYLKNHLNSKKKEKIHDHLLYGHGQIPKLLGYAAGFSLVQNYFKKSRFSTKLSFTIPASKFLSKKV
jgi:uncharacterized protein YjaZ